MERLKFSGAMLIFGTIGCFVRYLSLPSALIAMVRGAIGGGMLLLFLALRGQKLSTTALKKFGLPLFLSGAAMGFNWILLFEAYRYTSVAVATLCYYMAPILVIALAPLVLGEQLSRRQVACAGVAAVGMLLVSGVLGGQLPSSGELTGILLGLGAAVLYATVILFNKKLTGVPSYERVILQLLSAALVLLPYNGLTGGFAGLTLTPATLGLLLVVGVIHTGIAYALYFTSMPHLSGQTIAIYSYIDPAFAILLSIFLLGEGMDLAGLVGAVLILGATLASELAPARK